MISALDVLFALCAAGIGVSIFAPERSLPRVLAWFGSAASLAILWIGVAGLFSAPIRCSIWSIPSLGTLSIAIDRLGAYFLAVAALVLLPACIFSAGYLKRYLGRYSLRFFNFWYLALIGSIAAILIAGDVVSFLLAWEAMSIFSYLLVNFEHCEESHTRAGYMMLAMGEAGTLAAAVSFLLLAVAAGRLDFPSMHAAAPLLRGGARWAVFLLSFFGFGVKAGLAPVNGWLPRAHPVAPGTVSAVLSGAILNLGIYGIVRVNADLLPASLIGPGIVALIAGTITAFLGILYATTDNDLKVMLAHSSIENMGVITAGLGAGLVFIAAGHPMIATIAFVAALYHMANHSLYKALLFLGAASVDHHAGTRDLDRLGGLIRTMPWTALFFLAGALSISALPPFNGFPSEWLTLQTMLRSVELSSVAVKVIFALCGAVLALTAALAVTCFVKAFAMGFLGIARSSNAEQAKEAPRSMTAPMALLAILCLLFGVLPTYMISALDGVLTPLTHASAVEALVPPFFTSAVGHVQLPAPFAAEFHDLGAQVGESIPPRRSLVVMLRGNAESPVIFAMSPTYLFPVLAGLIGLVYVVVRFGAARRRRVSRLPAWAGGISRLLPEMTYTATGFSNPVRVVFDAVLRPATSDTRETIAEHFRSAIRHEREEQHVVDRLVMRPLSRAAMAIAGTLARIHHGRLYAYVTYGLAALIIVLVVTVSS
ncbi:MAG TPA: proton-conducting transporter membrane subunit [Thermoanaerobaculia bacterium]|nr:proton-conducting transporter membrane subunit [Thermoanaerobaculia bacterium]